jgi:Arc/MetJ-type ribon-helix-helix transcriptional regulator
MSQTNNGKPKESRRGRRAIGRDRVVAVRLPHEAIEDVDRLVRTLGLSSRSEAIRHMIIRPTASTGLLEIEGAVSPGLPKEIRSKERSYFEIEVFEREPGKWRASIRRSDGSKVRAGDMRFDLFTTSLDTSTADQALELARKAIDAGAVQ